MKTVFVANFLPDTNYTRDLSQGFIEAMEKRDKLFLCGRKGEPVIDGKKPDVDLVWKKGAFFFIPIFMYILKRRPNLIHFQHEFIMYGGVLSGFIFPWLILFLRIIKFKIVITLHVIISTKQLNKDFFESFGLKYNFLSRISAKLFLAYSYKLLVIFSNIVIVHTPLMRRVLIEQYKCNPDKIKVIELGNRMLSKHPIPIRNPYIVKKFPMLKNKDIILVFGRLSPRKGLEFLIHSFREMVAENKKKNWILVFAGEVSNDYLGYKQKIENLIEKLKISRFIVITGFVNEKEVEELHRMAKVSVIPALFSVSVSGAISTALAYKIPLLVANVSPIAEEVKGNNIGRIFDNANINSFAQELKKLISDRYNHKKIMSSIEKVAARRYWTVVAREHYKTYKNSCIRR